MEIAFWIFVVVVALMYVSGKQRQKRVRLAYTPYDDPKKMADGRWVSDALLSRHRLFGGKGIRLGDSMEGGRAIADNTDRHAVIVGPSGSGKGTCVQTQLALTNDHLSQVRLDMKGEDVFITAKHRASKGPLYILAPFTPESQLPKGCKKAAYNPLECLMDGTIPAIEVPSICAKISHVLIPDEGRGENQFFTTGGRNIWAACIAGAIRFGLPNEKNLPAIARIINHDFPAFCRRMALCGNKDLAGMFREYHDLYSSGNRAFMDQYQTAKTYSSFLLDPGVTELLGGKSGFKVADLKRKVGTVYVIVPMTQQECSGPLSRLLVGCFLSELTRLDAPKNRKVLMMCDEAYQYGNLAIIPATYAAGRGYGIRMVTIWQDLNQLSVYGRAGETLLANAGIRVFIAPQDNQTAEYVSKQCGMTQVVNRGKSVHLDQHGEPQVSDSMNPQTRPLLHPFEVLQLPADMALVWIRGLPGPLRTKLQPYYRDIRFFGKYGKNPYHA